MQASASMMFVSLYIVICLKSRIRVTFGSSNALKVKSCAFKVFVHVGPSIGVLKELRTKRNETRRSILELTPQIRQLETKRSALGIVEDFS